MRLFKIVGSWLAGWRDDGEDLAGDSGFDHDAALARYLERRLPPEPPESAPQAPLRPGLRRKPA